MKFVAPASKESHPVMQLLLLLAYAVAGALLMGMLGLVICFGLYGAEVWTDLTQLGTAENGNIGALRILQISSSIGIFVLPPLILARTEGFKIKDFYQLHQPKLNLLLLCLLIMAASLPLIEFLGIWNSKMVFPDFLKNLETWMRHKEDEAEALTLKLLKMRHWGDFVINLLMVAIIPAIGEELMFRGAIQRSLHRWYHNPHVAIWITAFLFSAIHFQFYGFFPRLILGACFGYLYYFSANIWYAILGHFLNNAFAVSVAFYMQMHHMPLESQSETINPSAWGYGIATILTFVLFLKYYQYGRADIRSLGKDL